MDESSFVNVHLAIWLDELSQQSNCSYIMNQAM